MPEFFVCPRRTLPGYSAIMTFLWGDAYRADDPETEPYAWAEGTPLEFDLPGWPSAAAWPGPPPGVAKTTGFPWFFTSDLHYESAALAA